MCILFIFLGNNIDESDYSLILISNRDEFYDRHAQSLGPWDEDPSVYGGRDLELGCDKGTWLSMSPLHKKIGVLLNLPGRQQMKANSRGKIAADYVKCNSSLTSYTANMKGYIDGCNGFVFVTADFGKENTLVQTYNNATNEIDTWTDSVLGFGNSLPKQPLQKVMSGKKKLEEICSKYNKIDQKELLLEELLRLLKSEEHRLPDRELQSRRPDIYKELSSVFVNIPQARYGTRAHTLILITKDGHIDLIEISLQSPINMENPKWKKVEFSFNINDELPTSHM